MKILFLFACIIISCMLTAQEVNSIIPFKKKMLLFSDDFTNRLDTALWKIEMVPLPHSGVKAIKGKLVMDSKGGVTTWLNKLLTGNILIEYKRTVLLAGGPNDRVSDLNQFWMATDHRNANLFIRAGVLESYDSLSLYYVGMGGNYNTTTRFRKYEGNGLKPLLQERLDSTHLLKGGKTYYVQTIVHNGTVQFIIDGKLFFSWKDPAPLTKGYFGFRSTWSRQAIDDVKVYRIE